MLILLADTSHQIESVALVQDGKLLGEKNILRSKGHAPGLLTDIDQLLQEQGLTVKDVDAFVSGMGPGSFTGIRVGMTTVKALAYTLNKPIYGVSTLLSLLTNMPYHKVLSVMDARRGELFVQGVGFSEAVCITPQQLIDQMPSDVQVLLGDGALRYQALFLEAFPQLLIPQDLLLHQPRAVKLLPYLGEPADVKTLEPIYLRASDAEINYPNGFPSEARLFALLKS